MHKTLLKTALLALGFGLAFAALSPAEASSCGGEGQQTCADAPGAAEECGAWLHEVGGICRPCGSTGLNACARLTAETACHAGLANHFGRCIRLEETAFRPARLDLSQIFGESRADKVRWAAGQYVEMISGAATGVSRALPAGRAAAELATALEARDGAAVKRLLEASPALRASFAPLQRMGFNTVTVGLQTRLPGGEVQETGFSLDLGLDWTPRLYTTAAVEADAEARPGSELVFTFLKPGNTRIDGTAYGAVTEAPAGTELVMWFSDTPFDFTGFSLGRGVESLWADGSVSFATTKLWN